MSTHYWTYYTDIVLCIVIRVGGGIPDFLFYSISMVKNVVLIDFNTEYIMTQELINVVFTLFWEFSDIKQKRQTVPIYRNFLYDN